MQAGLFVKRVLRNMFARMVPPPSAAGAAAAAERDSKSLGAGPGGDAAESAEDAAPRAADAQRQAEVGGRSRIGSLRRGAPGCARWRLEEIRMLLVAKSVRFALDRVC